MSDENDKTKEGQGTQAPTGTPSTTGPRAPLSLKPRAVGSVPTGTVRQSFSHGRTKTVAVEIKRRPGAPAAGHQRPAGFDVARPRTDAVPQPTAPRTAPSQPAGGRLSNEEQEARRRAIELATQAQAERAAAQAAEQARRDAAAREQAEAAERTASAAQAEAAAARA
ncbi:translation initiation factor IF-2 associated domain-containing protein, partial [Brevundimonas aurifodinae]